MSHDHFHPNSYLLIDLRQGTTLNYNNLQYLSLLLSLYMPLCRQSEEIKCFIQAIRTCNISASFLPFLPTRSHRITSNCHFARNSLLKRSEYQCLSVCHSDGCSPTADCAHVSSTRRLAKRGTSNNPVDPLTAVMF